MRVGRGTGERRLTIVGTDQADVFVEQLNPADLDEARHHGAWYPLRIVVDTIRVKGEAARVVRHRYSRHGPVFYVDSANHVAYAIRSTSMEPGTAGYLGALRLAEVEDCHGFIDAMAYWKAPTENMMCGDVDGNIAWLAAALSPRRSGGWYGRLPVPGGGRYRWDGFRSHTELPQEFNPSRGWIGTANKTSSLLGTRRRSCSPRAECADASAYGDAVGCVRVDGRGFRADAERCGASVVHFPGSSALSRVDGEGSGGGVGAGADRCVGWHVSSVEPGGGAALLLATYPVRLCAW